MWTILFWVCKLKKPFLGYVTGILRWNVILTVDIKPVNILINTVVLLDNFKHFKGLSASVKRFDEYLVALMRGKFEELLGNILKTANTTKKLVAHIRLGQAKNILNVEDILRTTGQVRLW